MGLRVGSIPGECKSECNFKLQRSLADLGFFKGGGDFGNPSERSERALRGLGLWENDI